MLRRPRHRLLARLEESLDRAEDANDLVSILAEQLGAEFDVARVSIRALGPGPSFLTIIALWVDDPETTLRRGQRMHFLGTAYAEVLDRGIPRLVPELDPNAGIAEQLLHADGIVSYATLPLRPKQHPAGLLSISSRRLGEFRTTDMPLFTTVAGMVETTLDRLPRPEQTD